MKKRSEKVVFFGSGPVSAASLSFVKNCFEIEAIITKPSTELQMQSILREKPVYCVKNKQELTELVLNKKFQSKLGLVIDFGIIIEKSAIDYFQLGIVNSHFSLLPRWRGADPISFAILSGDKTTGVSLMLVDESLDTGKLIAQKSIELAPGYTTPTLTQDLINLSNQMLADYIPDYVRGKVKPYPQPRPEAATYSRKLEKMDGIIDWSKPAENLERQIRAFSGWPRSTGKIGNHSFIVTAADVVNKNGKPGDYEATNKSLVVFCGKNALDIKEVQPPGKKQMPISAFLAGYKLS